MGLSSESMELLSLIGTFRRARLLYFILNSLFGFLLRFLSGRIVWIIVLVYNSSALERQTKADNSLVDSKVRGSISYFGLLC